MSRAVYGQSTQDRHILHAASELTRPMLLMFSSLAVIVEVVVVLRGTNAAATVNTAWLLASLLAAAAV